MTRFLLQGKALKTKLKTYGGEKGKKTHQIPPMDLCMFKKYLLFFHAKAFSIFYQIFPNIGFYIHCWRYTYSSVESQIRVLGDYAFMLGDYELALSNYRLISTDYKIDKAWKRYAGVQVSSNFVSIIICCLLLLMTIF